MSEERETPFQALVDRALRSEVAPAQFQCHPSLEDLMAHLSGDIAPDTREDVLVHLTLCASCRKRWASLGEAARCQEDACRDSVSHPTLSSLLEEKSQRSWPHRVRSRITEASRSLVPAWSLYGALATAVVTAAVCLCILLPPAAREWAQVTPSTGGHGVSVPKEPAGSAPVPDLLPWETPEALLRGVDSMAQFPLGRAVARAIGQLRAADVPLGLEGAAFTEVTAYIVREDDSWELIADACLGSPALWPLVLLLNSEMVSDGNLPPPGRIIQVPVPKP